MVKVKGVILAGGLGKRLYPLTKITNKHLLPIYNRPMIYYPLETLIEAGIEDILIVTGGNNAGDFLRLLGNGSEFGLKHINYTYQQGEGGIADALALAEHFSKGEKIVVILGDNILEKGIKKGVEKFAKQGEGARIFLKEVDNPKEYGIAEIEEGRIINIVEKPLHPKSHYAVTGIYMYDNQAFDIIKPLTPSARGELEITDVNNIYIKQGTMTYEILEGWWGDAGESIDAYLRINNLVAEREKSRR